MNATKLYEQLNPIAEMTGDCLVRIRYQGLGPEDIIGTLATSVSKLKGEYDKLKAQNKRIKIKWALAVLDMLTEDPKSFEELRQDKQLGFYIDKLKELHNASQKSWIPQNIVTEELTLESPKLTLTPELYSRFTEYLKMNPGWGSLHIVLSDYNVDNDNVEWCLNYAKTEGDVKESGWLRSC